MQTTLVLQVTSYAIESAQQRGRLFCASGDEVYEGQVVGIHQRAGDLRVNVCKRKAANNIRRWAARCYVSLAKASFTPGLGEEPCVSHMRRRKAVILCAGGAAHLKVGSFAAILCSCSCTMQGQQVALCLLYRQRLAYSA